jgi:hypothetical protein
MSSCCLRNSGEKKFLKKISAGLSQENHSVKRTINVWQLHWFSGDFFQEFPPEFLQQRFFLVLFLLKKKNRNLWPKATLENEKARR